MKYRLILLCFSLCWTFAHAQTPKVETLPIGAAAPDFNLPGVDDKMYSLADFKEYPFLAVLFTCNHCPTAQAYEDKFIQIVDKYRPRGVGFVAISPNSNTALSLAELGYSDLDDSMEAMKIRHRDKGYNFPYLYDGDSQETSIAYGPVATPHVFVFDRDRKLQYVGRIDDTENPYVEPKTIDLKNALDELLAGRPVSVPTNKTFGCSVKWAWKDEWTKKLLDDWAKAPVSLEEIDLAGVGKLMKNESGKLRLINIWATWCGPCIIEFPEFVSMDRMYRGRDFEFVSLTTDKLRQKQKALDFLTKKEAANQNYIFSGDNIYDLIEAVDPKWQGSLPYTVLLEPGGKVLFRQEGAIDPLEVKRAIIGYLGRYYADDK